MENHSLPTLRQSFFYTIEVIVGISLLIVFVSFMNTLLPDQGKVNFSDLKIQFIFLCVLSFVTYILIKIHKRIAPEPKKEKVVRKIDEDYIPKNSGIKEKIFTQLANLFKE